MFKNIKHIAFWPAFILVGGAVILNFVNNEWFTAIFNGANNFFMSKMGWFANILTIVCLVVCIWAMLSKFGSIRIGGKNAKPKLSNFSWFSISLTSTLAAGLLLWGPSEPIYHIQDPAAAITGIEPMSGDAYLFSMETMFMHWSFLPYGIMAIAGVAFAFMYYNGKGSYSVVTQLSPILGKHNNQKIGSIVDGFILFAITVAIASSLGALLLNINYGVEYTTGINSNNTTMLIIVIVLVALTVISAVTGLEKGIKFLADWNVYGYIVLIGGILVLGPTAFILNLGTEGFASFLAHIFDRSMVTGVVHQSQWPQWWTTFYWASYFAWTPTIGLFLGSIAYGRTIRQFLGVNLFMSGGFGALWVMIFGGTSLERQFSGIKDLVSVSAKDGVGAIPYEALGTLPLGTIICILYLVIMLISFVTSVNANISVMAGLATKNISLEDPTGAPSYQKIIWGVLSAALAYIVGSTIGIDGLKALCNVAGIAAIFIQLGIVASVILLISKWKKFDKTETDIETEDEENGVEVS